MVCKYHLNYTIKFWNFEHVAFLMKSHNGQQNAQFDENWYFFLLISNSTIYLLLLKKK